MVTDKGINERMLYQDCQTPIHRRGKRQHQGDHRRDVLVHTISQEHRQKPGLFPKHRRSSVALSTKN